MSAPEGLLSLSDLAALEQALATVREKIALERSVRSQPNAVKHAAVATDGSNEQEREILTAKAAALYAGRRARERVFEDPSLFSDPAWDIMLDLFISKDNQRLISVSSACIGAMVAPTTALRWIDGLVKKELLERVPDRCDRRRSFVRLTERGEQLVAKAVALA